MLADCFWWQDRKVAGQPMPGVHSYLVLAGWCHGDRFNALSGGGSVRAVQDDPQRSPVKANSIPASGQGPQPTGPCDATAAERVWQFLDLGGRLN